MAWDRFLVIMPLQEILVLIHFPTPFNMKRVVLIQEITPFEATCFATSEVVISLSMLTHTHTHTHTIKLQRSKKYF